MSILIDALKKSKAGRSETSTFLKSPPTPPTRSSGLKLPSARIAALCALLAIVLYMGIVSLTKKPSSQNLAKAAPTLLLQPLPALGGIVWDAESPIAILEGQPMKIGDMAGAWKLESIFTDRVHLSSRGITKTLTLPKAQLQQ